MRRLLLASAALALLAVPTTANAAAEKYLIEKPHTQILFSVEHMGFSRSYGKFIDYSGEIMWDKADPTKSSVNVKIPVSSLDMGDAVWKEHLLAEKMFNVVKYPDMTFKSTSIAVSGDKSATITGDLTLHGVTKPVTLNAKLRKAEMHPMMKKEWAGFSATTTIKRSDFDMKEGIPFVGDEIEITLEVEAYQDGPAGTKLP